MEYLVITRDPRIPDEIKNEQLTVWTVREFWDTANSDDGLEIPDGGIYYNLDSLNQEVYEAIEEYQLPTVFYRWDDYTPNFPFEFNANVKVFSEPKKVEPNYGFVDKPQSLIEKEKNRQEEVISEPEQPKIEPSKPEIVPQRVIQDDESHSNTIAGLETVEINGNQSGSSLFNTSRLDSLLNSDDAPVSKSVDKPAKVILFGSSKGGTGKTFTCLISARRYALTHPDKRVALADFDIIDGQIGITIFRNTPTLIDYYKQYKAGNNTFKYLSNCSHRNEHFSPNLDFYLAPPLDIPEVTNNKDFWKNVFELLIMNYDVVFFDSGIDYLGKAPISRLYKIADKIIITTNTSINSVKSTVRQLQTLKGERADNVFVKTDDILSRVNLVLTRVSNSDSETNNMVVKTLTQYAPIIAPFGNLDEQITRTQWYQQWDLWDGLDKVNMYLDRIVDLGEN